MHRDRWTNPAGVVFDAAATKAEFDNMWPKLAKLTSPYIHFQIREALMENKICLELYHLLSQSNQEYEKHAQL